MIEAMESFDQRLKADCILIEKWTGKMMETGNRGLIRPLKYSPYHYLSTTEIQE